jgi:hypothetical protein
MTSVICLVWSAVSSIPSFWRSTFNLSIKFLLKNR